MSAAYRSKDERRKIPNFERVALHKQYIQDEARNRAYRAAIYAGVDQRSTVLDVGCGSGILTFFAVQAGCKKVYAIERSGFIEHAKRTAELNGLADRISFLRTDIFAARLPERVDIAIHDQIGQTFWGEGMVEKLNFVRQKFLRPYGRIIPARADLLLVPIDFPALASDQQFWNTSHYGINFANLAEVERMQRASQWEPMRVDLRSDEMFLAQPQRAHTVDFGQAGAIPEHLEMSFRATRSGRCTAVLGFFTIHLDSEIQLSTSPVQTPTNWGQLLLPLLEEATMSAGDTLELRVGPAIEPREWTIRAAVRQPQRWWIPQNPRDIT